MHEVQYSNGAANVYTTPVVTNIDTSSHSYVTMVDALERSFRFKSETKTNGITTHEDFSVLDKITSSFYVEQFPEIVRDFLPLYHSVWKQRWTSPPTDNLHQDRSIFHFAKNGYDSRMLNVWINIKKDCLPAASESALGISIVDRDNAVNAALYNLLRKANTHFVLKQKGQFVDNTYIAGQVVKFDESKLVRSALPYTEGTSIVFDSHLLHGTSLHETINPSSALALSSEGRVSLTSIWVHKEDFKDETLLLDQENYESLYLARHDRSLWPDLKKWFPQACESEQHAIGQILQLVRSHVE